MKNLPVLLAIVTSLSAKTWVVGPTRSYTAPRQVSALVSDGDTILIDAGTYADETATWSRHGLLLRGVGGSAHLVAPATIPNQKAIWVVSGNDATIEGIEFSGAAVPDWNGAGIRAEGVNLTVRRSYFHDNENGILGGKGTVRIEDSEFDRNGHGDGFSHNLYIANCDTFSMVRSLSHHARIGHEVKSRAKVNILVGNWIGNETDGTASYEIDLPNGGTSVIVGNFIQQAATTENPTIVTFGEEGLTNPGKELHLAHNTIVNSRPGGTFVRVATGATASLTNNLFVGSGTVASGTVDELGSLVGLTSDFVDAASFDYRLRAGSSAIGNALPVGSVLGISLLPATQYRHGVGSASRPLDRSPDIGAWEYSSSDAVAPRDHGRRMVVPRLGFDPSEEVRAGSHALDGAILQGGRRPAGPVVRP